MYLSQEAVKLLHEERVNDIKMMSKPLLSPNQKQAFQNIWASLRGLVQAEDQTQQTETEARPSHLSTQEWAVVSKK